MSDTISPAPGQIATTDSPDAADQAVQADTERAVRALAKTPIHVIELDPRDPNERWHIDSGWLAEEALRIFSLAKRTISDVIEIGYRLSICKGHLDHGDWLPWLEREFGWSEKTAERYLHIYELSKSDNLSNLSLSDLNLPLSALHIIAQPSTPQEAVAEVVKEAGNNKKMSVKHVDAIIRKYKPREPQPKRAEDQKAADLDWHEVETVEVPIEAEATAKKPNGSSAEDKALFEFTAHVLELLRLTRGHEAKRFAGTAVKADELALLARFLTALAITIAGDPAPTPPTGANGQRVETAPSVQPCVGTPEKLAAKVAELVATFPSDLAIPPFLLRRPPEPPSDPEPTLVEPKPEPAANTASPSMETQEQTVEIEQVIQSDVPPIPIPTPPAPPPSAPSPPIPSLSWHGRVAKIEGGAFVVISKKARHKRGVFSYSAAWRPDESQKLGLRFFAANLKTCEEAQKIAEDAFARGLHLKPLKKKLPAKKPAAFSDDPWPRDWLRLCADDLEEVIRKTQRYGVDHPNEDHGHKQRRLKQIDRMKKRVAELRATEKAAARMNGAATASLPA